MNQRHAKCRQGVIEWGAFRIARSRAVYQVTPEGWRRIKGKAADDAIRLCVRERAKGSLVGAINAELSKSSRACSGLIHNRQKGRPSKWRR
jgi:hypothetical protein